MINHAIKARIKNCGWLGVCFTFLLALAACGVPAPIADQGEGAISLEEAEAAVLKLQNNAGLNAATSQNLSALSDQQLTAAWSRLSEREQEAAELFLKPAGEETGTSGQATGPEGELAAQAAGCWYQTWWAYATNVFGNKLWQYNQRLRWCSNGYLITSNTHEVWGETYWIGWRYDREVNWWRYGGWGYTYFQRITQGHFELGSGGWNVQHSYPRIDSIVYR
jgi:hypothetical protein